MKTEKLADFVLRAGLAFAFLYPPYAAWKDPPAWLAYFPPFMHGWVPPEILLHSFGALEVLLAIWILSGWRIFWPCIIAAAMLLGIVLFNTPEFSVLFRDLSIAAMALALAFMHGGSIGKALPADIRTS
jgi:uncharacterized membrane protein YphA (DoxX/SURF4 family)